jgi:hypothetical protein
MKPKHQKLFTTLLLISASMAVSAGAIADSNATGRADNFGSRGHRNPPLIIAEQGSFTVGGKVITAPGIFDPYNWSVSSMPPAGQTFHGDHLFAFYQIPENARKLPLVMWHGNEEFAKTWETTPDGREGFQTIFLRRGFGVYLIDQPRRGGAGRSTLPITITPTPDEQSAGFGLFRLGIWPNFFPNAQFSRDPEALNQFFRWRTPNTGPFDLDVVSDGVKALFDKIGSGVLLTHSAGGGPGWLTAIKSRDVRAVVSFEPGSNFVFAEGEVPPPIPGSFDTLTARSVPESEFKRLTEIPILLFYGDNIPETPTASPGQDAWRVRLQMARLWRDAVNRRGGDVTLIHLPDIGIKGNTHFPFADLNNVQIADLMSKWLREKGLDGTERGEGYDRSTFRR